MEAHSTETIQGHPDPSRVALDEPFVDKRGRIQNITQCAVGGVAVIESWPGAIRSNHFHKTDCHWLYCVQGEAVYRYRPVGSKDERSIEVKEGDCIFTPPMVEHRIEFLGPYKTILVSCSKLPRDHETHEADLVRVEW